MYEFLFWLLLVTSLLLNGFQAVAYRNVHQDLRWMRNNRNQWKRDYLELDQKVQNSKFPRSAQWS